ncbi:MAG: pilus assembly protein [Pseudorhodobacter sp.]|nr:pilus assembly protein [Pseudorhodobacter sp.]
MAARLPALIPQAMRREDGTATMEFVLVIPLIMMIFMASFESGLLMIRAILLEQSVDMTMRELRLGHYAAVTNYLLKKEICSRTIIFPDCMDNMKIEMDRVSTATWNIPVQPAHCINRHEAAEPVVSMGAIADNDLMVVRVCVTLQAMFPSTGIGLNLPLDTDGGYGLVARTAFVVEPS